MKVLQLTPQAPGNNNGGAICVFNDAEALCSFCETLDYVGPPIANKEIKQLYNHIYELEECGFFKRITNLIFRGVTNSRFSSWRKTKIDYEKYDYIVLEFTKLDFVLEKINPKRLIVRAHNVEFDYSLNDYKKSKSFEKWIIHELSYRQEKKLLSKAKKIVALTERDVLRFCQLYQVEKNKFALIPLCSHSQNEVTIRKDYHSSLRLLITGSLFYGPNVDGAIWFVTNVFSKLNGDVSLTIAGFKPSNSLRKVVENDKRIVLVDSPNDMDCYFRDCDLYIAPLFSGSGMKTKVVEALSYGLPIIGTDEAFVGYNVIDNKNAFLANNANQFLDVLNGVMDRRIDLDRIRIGARDLFEDNHSMERLKFLWSEVVK